jgi:hypothetical protein
MRSDRATTDRIHALVEPVQPPAREPVSDPLRGIAKRQQLTASDHPMLPLNQIPGRSPLLIPAQIQRPLIL